MRKNINRISVLLVSLFFVWSCSTDAPDPEGTTANPPSVSGISITEGMYGDTVLITGTEFSEDTLVNNVSFIQRIVDCNGLTSSITVNAKVLKNTKTQLTVLVPKEGYTCPGTVTAKVRVQTRVAFADAPQEFIYKAPFESSKTTMAVGEKFTVTAYNKKDNNTIAINGTAVQVLGTNAFVLDNKTHYTYTCVVAEGTATGAGVITVTNDNNRELLDTTAAGAVTINAVNNDFTFTQSASTPGASVKITVNNTFGYSNKVKIGTKDVDIVSITSISDTQDEILVYIPVMSLNNGETYDVIVTSPAGTSLNNTSGQMSYSYN